MSESIYISLAVTNLEPTAEFTFTNDDVNTIKSLNSVKLPTVKDIESEIKRIKAKEIQDANNLKAQKDAILARLGLTEEEAKILLS